MKRVFIAIWFISSSLSAADLIDVNALEKQFESRIKKYTLDNKIRVILMKNGFTPTIACYLKVGVGSANEPFDQAGTAHFLEHLLFKGNRQMGTTDYEGEKLYLEQIMSDGEKIDDIRRQLQDPLLSVTEKQSLSEKMKQINSRLEYLQKYSQRFILSEEDSQAYSLAGQVGYNAYTSNDVTNYQIKLPKNRLELWAFIESNRYINPVFREFYAERKVIQEERRMRLDSKPGSLLHELYLKTAFGMSPYGKPVIGYESNIDKLTMSETYDFFENNYIPSRMVITIVGDIEFEPTVALIKKYFEKIPPREAPGFPPIEFETQKVRKTAELHVKHTPMMITGWHKPSIYHEDDLTFEVLSKLLTGGQNSRLVKRLVIDDKLATYIRSYNGNPGEKLENSFSIYLGAYKEENYDKIFETIKEELNKLAENGPDEEELARVRNNFNASLVNSLASNGGLAESLSYYELLLSDYRAFFTYLKKIQAISKSDVQKIIKKYLVDERNTLVTIRSKPE